MMFKQELETVYVFTVAVAWAVDDGEYVICRLARERAPLVITRNNIATAQIAIAIVRSQLLTSCHTGKVNRKKFSGL